MVSTPLKRPVISDGHVRGIRLKRYITMKLWKITDQMIRKHAPQCLNLFKMIVYGLYHGNANTGHHRLEIIWAMKKTTWLFGFCPNSYPKPSWIEDSVITLHVSNEKTPVCSLGHIQVGNYTSQLCGDYNKPLYYKDTYWISSISWRVSGRVLLGCSFIPISCTKKTREARRLVLRHTVTWRCLTLLDLDQL